MASSEQLGLDEDTVLLDRSRTSPGSLPVPDDDSPTLTASIRTPAREAEQTSRSHENPVSSMFSVPGTSGFHRNSGQYYCNAIGCREYGRAFATASAVKKHLKNHMPYEARPYACDMCPQNNVKRFLFPKDLHRHVRDSHSGDDRPYDCFECGTRFKRKEHLRRHHLQGRCPRLKADSSLNAESQKQEIDVGGGSALPESQLILQKWLSGDVHLESSPPARRLPTWSRVLSVGTAAKEPDATNYDYPGTRDSPGDETSSRLYEDDSGATPSSPQETEDLIRAGIVTSSWRSSAAIPPVIHSAADTGVSVTSSPSETSGRSHARLVSASGTEFKGVDPHGLSENLAEGTENGADDAESSRTDSGDFRLTQEIMSTICSMLAGDLLQNVDLSRLEFELLLRRDLFDLVKHCSDTVGSLAGSITGNIASKLICDSGISDMMVSKKSSIGENLPTTQREVSDHNVSISAISKSYSSPTSIDPSNTVEEVTEVDETTMLANLHPHLPAAWKFLRESQEYAWLRRRIVQRQTFTIKGCEIYRGVRQAVTEYLAPPNSPPLGSHHSLNLLVDWDPVDYVQTQFQGHNKAALIGPDIVLCGEYPNVEAWACEDYVAEIWPEIGPQLLRGLIATLSDTPERSDRESFGDHITELQLGQFTRCRLSYLLGGTRCEVQGYLLHVVQVAEVLAWLGAGCRASPHSEQPAHCTPEVRINGNSITIGYSHEAMTETFTQDADAGCWRQMTRNPTIVTGYPRSLRHRNEMGLEASLPAMVALGRTNLASHFDGHLLLKGDRSMLVPAGKRGDSIIWHFIRGAADTFLSYMESVACKTIAAVSYEDVSNCRHFIGWTQEATSIAGTKLATYDIGPSGCEPPGPTHLLTGLTLSFSKILAVGASMTLAHRHTPLVFERSQPYGVKIRIAAGWTVLMYDAASRLGWLMDGATALMHLARTWLFRNQFLFGDVDIGDKIQEIDSQTSDWARKTLSHHSNGRMRLHPKSPTYDWQDEDIRPWFGTVASSDCTDWALFQERVECLHDALAKIDGEVRKRKATAGIQLRRSDRSLEGFDLADVLDEIEGTESKAQVLRKDAMPWLKMVNENNTICLLGSGFGQLIRPVQNICPARAMVPTGSDCLATCVSTLQIFQRVTKSNPKCDRVELGNSFFLQYPLSAFEKSSKCAQCRLGSWCPNTISRLSTNNLLMKRPREAAARHATSLWHYDRGAIIFGGELCRVSAKAGRWAAAEARWSEEIDAITQHEERGSSSTTSNTDSIRFGYALDSSESRETNDSSSSSRLRAGNDTPPSSVHLPQAWTSDPSQFRSEQLDVCSEGMDMLEPSGTPSAMVDSLDGSDRSSNDRMCESNGDPGTSTHDRRHSDDNDDNAQEPAYHFDVQGLHGSLPYYPPLRDLNAQAQSSGGAPGRSCDNATAHSLSASNKPKLRKRPKMR